MTTCNGQSGWGLINLTNHGRENHSSGINELSPKQYPPHFIICFIHLSRGLVIENDWREENGCVSLQWRSRYFLHSCLASGAGIWCCCIHGNTTIASSRMNNRGRPTIVTASVAQNDNETICWLLSSIYWSLITAWSIITVALFVCNFSRSKTLVKISMVAI